MSFGVCTRRATCAGITPGYGPTPYGVRQRPVGCSPVSQTSRQLQKFLHNPAQSLAGRGSHQSVSFRFTDSLGLSSRFRITNCFKLSSSQLNLFSNSGLNWFDSVVSGSTPLRAKATLYSKSLTLGIGRTAYLSRSVISFAT